MARAYKSIQLPSHLQVNARSDNPVGDFINKILDDQSQLGWTYQNTATATQYVPAGCLLALLGAKGSYSTLNILIFYRDQP